VLDEPGVLERFGVPASRYLDFAILRGDPSDGLPGVRGVGEKTARTLVNEYPSLDELIADANAQRRTGRSLQRSPGLCGKIRGATDYLAAMREVVPIRTDLEVRAWKQERDDSAADELAERYRLTGPVGRLRRALDGNLART